ncbi:unnamed protein product [Dracunculus medinensis]|uniref:Acyl_transf_3 domain-containing protein n=1 Tax=Dracunculus medinensis TaxID=318479 RepID=A0A158Q2T0_DRAME|nr:unnamed protein product [Dracunculus medinensis]
MACFLGHYKFLKCISTADETAYSRSEHPLMYCNGHFDENGDQITVGACLPAPCISDQITLINEYARASFNFGNKTMINQNNIQCTKSRFDVECNPRTMLTCLFGLRFLATLWVILGHSSIFIQDYLNDADAYRKDLANSFFSQFITNSTLSVDVFFLIGGTLVSFHWFGSVQKAGTFFRNSNFYSCAPKWSSFGYWLSFYRHRAIRILPLYFYSISLMSNRLAFSNFQPIWFPNDQSFQCSGQWWKNILFINSLTDNICMPWTWYIGTDFIFYLVTPIYFLCFHQSFSIGIVQHRLVYIKPQYRISPYIIGLILGYTLSTHPAEEKRRLSKATITAAWILAIICAFTSLFGIYPAFHEWDWPNYYLFYGAFHRSIWSLSIAWLVYACHMGFGGFINHFLSLIIFQPLSSISYSAYLLHMFGIITFFVTTQFPIVYDGIIQTLFRFTFLQILLTYAAGFYALIVIELPALNLENLFIQRPKIKLNKNGRGSRDSKDDKTKEQCSEFVSHKPRLISASTKSQDKE